MSNNNLKESAFPIVGSNDKDIREVEVKETGFTKHEYAAIKIAQGLASTINVSELTQTEFDSIIETSYTMASKLLNKFK